MGFPFLGKIPWIFTVRHPDKLGAYREAKYKLDQGIACGSSPLLARVITLGSDDAVNGDSPWKIEA
jgi:hypothetical protein